jgi:AbrB family looped-hinge helix DNA binding protein
MSKVTRKLQVSIPKALADRLGIGPGDDLQWEEVAGGLRVRLGAPPEQPRFSIAERLQLFDAATARQAARQRGGVAGRVKARGWTREELYDRDVRKR